MKKCISIIFAICLIVGSATAETKQTYSGVILSSRKSLDESFKFLMLRKERLTETSTHYVDVRAVDVIQPYARSKSLCRKASIRRIQKSSRVRVTCSPNIALHTFEQPNDTFFSQQYGMQLMSMPYTWDVQKGSPELLALVVDTGIDATHPDLQANMWVNPNEIPNNKIDDDGNGYIDDVHGINAITNSGSGHDDNGHGTHVAGIIGAQANNYLGVAGVAHRVKIVSLKFLSSSGTGSTANAIKAINYGIQLKRAGHKVVVMNNSYGSNLFSKPFLDVIRAANLEDIAFVAAAGNSSKNTDVYPAYPASYDSNNVISVGSVDSSVIYNSWSNYGVNSVDVAAPGGMIYSTIPLSKYGYKSGTSMAAPHVAGLTILAKSHCTTLDVNTMKSHLMSSVVKYSKLTTKVASGGVVNGVGLLDVVAQTCGNLLPTPTPTMTPDPSVSPSPTPTMTPTPTSTPTQTPTPLPSPSVKFSSSVLYPEQTVTLYVEGSPENIANVQVQLKLSNDTLYSCTNKPVKLTGGARTYRVTLPKELAFFPSLNVLLKAPGVIAQSTHTVKSSGGTISRPLASVVCSSIYRQIDW